MAASDELWFLNTRVSIRVAAAAGSDGISVIEHHAPFADSPPLHIHRGEDEVFHVLDGRLRLRIADSAAAAGPGETLLAPRGVPHSYCVDSPGGARWLTVTCGRDFERFVRALGRPPEGPGLPEPSGPPSPEQAAALGELALAHGIELVGPPLEPLARGTGEPVG